LRRLADRLVIPPESPSIVHFRARSSASPFVIKRVQDSFRFNHKFIHHSFPKKTAPNWKKHAIIYSFKMGGNLGLVYRAWAFFVSGLRIFSHTPEKPPLRPGLRQMQGLFSFSSSSKAVPSPHFHSSRFFTLGFGANEPAGAESDKKAFLFKKKNLDFLVD